MGSSIDTECKNCGDRESYLLGVGMDYADFSDVMSLIKGNTRKKLKDIVENYQNYGADYSHTLYACPKCNTLHNRFWVSVKYGKNKVYETSFRCGKCRTHLVKAKQPINSYTCKKCGRRELEKAPGILWD